MVVFDTDIVTILQKRVGPEFESILKHIRSRGELSFYVSIITFEEQIRGWLNFIKRAKSGVEEVNAYSKLAEMQNYFKGRPILPFDSRASQIASDFEETTDSDWFNGFENRCNYDCDWSCSRITKRERFQAGAGA